jgi:uncharacterized protein (DUF1810 family)
MNTGDPHDLERFLDAQQETYARVLRELQAGRKQSHWIWYIFPQIKGLGTSPMAQKYAIASLDEAKAYLNHPVLAARLQQCTQLVTAVSSQSIDEIFGYPDNLKFHSSMTLFAHAANDNPIFMDALRKYFRSEFDRQTIDRLGYSNR